MESLSYCPYRIGELLMHTSCYCFFLLHLLLFFLLHLFFFFFFFFFVCVCVGGGVRGVTRTCLMVVRNHSGKYNILSILNPTQTLPSHCSGFKSSQHWRSHSIYPLVEVECAFHVKCVCCFRVQYLPVIYSILPLEHYIPERKNQQLIRRTDCCFVGLVLKGEKKRAEERERVCVCENVCVLKIV